MFSSSVAFSGSRAVAGSPCLAAAASIAVREVAVAGGLLSVGCCVGADAAVLNSAVALGVAPSVSVYSAFGPGALGAVSVSNWGGVYRAQDSGATIHWWAGGNQSVPPRARLVNRSLACIRSASVLVAFVVGPLPVPFKVGPSTVWPWSGGSGSWSSVGAAALLGHPVVLVPVGWSSTLAALPVLPAPCGGSWSSGLWSGSWLWSPALFG